MKNKKGFTLVELLAVIVVLAVILIIAVPQVMETIRSAKLGAMESSTKLLATSAEKKYYLKKMEDKSYTAVGIPCTDVAKLTIDYSSCTITYDEDGKATVELIGSAGGKYSGITCNGSKDNVRCKQALPGYTDAILKITSLCTNECLKSENNDGTVNSDGLLQDKHGDYRYQGSNPNNYVTFNDEEAGWRIVGLFNIDGEQRVKLIKIASIGKYSWDSSEGTINSGNGVNEWSQADVKQLLNEYYYNGITEADCYVGKTNATETCTFRGMNSKSKKLIGTATWYLGGARYQDTLDGEYDKERGTTTCQASGATGCVTSSVNDGVARTTSWRGKIGLIYPSDFAYASANSGCKDKISTGCGNNWLASAGWTITSYSTSANATFYTGASSAIGMQSYTKVNVKPSVYLISGVQMKGSGTTEDPYIFAE